MFIESSLLIALIVAGLTLAGIIIYQAVRNDRNR